MVSINKAYKTRGLTKIEKNYMQMDLLKMYMSIVDAGFMLHFMLDLPSTFGEVASLIIGKLCAMSSGVDLVCDTYQSTPLKTTRKAAEIIMKLHTTYLIHFKESLKAA